MTGEQTYRFGNVEFQPAQRRLRVSGQLVTLGARAIDLLQILIERRDRTVTKGELLDHVWANLVVEEANLHVQVSALRKVLGVQAIMTVPGRGYRFVALLDQGSSATDAHGARASPASASGPDQLIGRDEELASVLKLLDDERVVSLVGTGGIGKTRLAATVTEALGSRWADGTAWVDAGWLDTASGLPHAVARAATVEVEVPTPAQLAHALRHRRMLLVMDNCEHVVEGAASVVSALLDAAPDVRVLVTSQRPLHLPQEHVFRLNPLTVPAPGDAALESFGAVQLFAARARAVDRSFHIDASTQAAVGDICRRLDGLPLALELAAAHVKLLGVHGLGRRLDHQLDLLGKAHVDAFPRHQTLRAALSWSYSMLAPQEQVMLRRLAVFVGGWTVELAHSVSGEASGSGPDEWEVLETLGALVDKSLVRVDAGAPPRYRLLQPLRDFALEQLEAAGDDADARRRHAHAVCTLFEAADEARWGDDGCATAAQVTAWLTPEIENARAALAWLVANGEWPAAAGLAGAAATVYTQLGLIRELLPVMRRLVPHIDTAPPSARVNLLLRLGAAGIQDGMHVEELLQLKTRAVEAARAGGFRRRLQMTLAACGFTLARRGDVPGARQIIEEMTRLAHPGDPPVIRAMPYSVELMLHEHLQDPEAVITCLGRQRAILLGAPDETVPLLTCESNLVLYLNCVSRHAEAAELGKVLVGRSDLPKSFVHAVCHTAYALCALGRLHEALDVMQPWRSELERTPIGVYSGEALGMLCLTAGRLADAVRIDGAIDRHIRSGSGKLHPMTRAHRARLEAAIAAAHIDAADLHRWRGEGEVLTDVAAVELALGSAGLRAGTRQ